MATVNFELYSDDLYLPSVERGGGEREREMAEGYDEEVNYDEATLAQYERIQKEVEETSEYISEKDEVCCLAREYSTDDTIYQTKIKDLCKKYSHMRKTRGDGNCFYRAFAFAYMEKMIEDHSDVIRLKDTVTELKRKISSQNAGYDYDEFHDVFIDLLETTTNPGTTVDQLLSSFCDASITNYVVCYLRILTSGYLKLNREFFQAFIEGGLTVEQYCVKEVDPMYCESDHIHITALTAALGISVRVEYMDRGEGGKVNHHDFPEGHVPFIHLLYRPGHYDLLYPISPTDR